MTTTELLKLAQRLNEKERELLIKKGGDYSGETDTLSNFKIIGKLLNRTPLEICAVYTMKHILAIMNFVKDGKLRSEPIEGRILDARNYLLLFYVLALIEEAGKDEREDL